MHCRGWRCCSAACRLCDCARLATAARRVPPPLQLQAPVVMLFNGGEETLSQAANGFMASSRWVALGAGRRRMPLLRSRVRAGCAARPPTAPWPAAGPRVLRWRGALRPTPRLAFPPALVRLACGLGAFIDLACSPTCMLPGFIAGLFTLSPPATALPPAWAPSSTWSLLAPGALMCCSSTQATGRCRPTRARVRGRQRRRARASPATAGPDESFCGE